MRQRFNILLITIGSLLILSCEDRIYPTLESAAPVYMVDAWLNNSKGNQVIVLTKSQAYFDYSLSPAVSGASVRVTDDVGTTYTFVEDLANKGNYVWHPTGGHFFAEVGNKFDLKIIVGGETLTSSCKIGRVPPIDSITFDTDKRATSNDMITRGEFWATDPAGPGDAYWIRTFKNGILLNKPSEINIAYDAGFSPGGETDGVTFITPIRRGINSNDNDVNGKRLSPIVTGDSLYVQIFSISYEAFTHLSQVSVQTDRPGGFQELFATPLANVSTNMTNANPNGTVVQGFFNVSAVSSAGKRYTK